MKKNFAKLTAIALASAPLLALAQVNLITQLGTILRSLVPIFITVAVLYFMWGLIKYISASAKGDKGEQEHGKAIMIWGVVALFVMVSVWGLVAALGTTTGIQQTTAPNAGNLIPSAVQ